MEFPQGILHLIKLLASDVAISIQVKIFKGIGLVSRIRFIRFIDKRAALSRKGRPGRSIYLPPCSRIRILTVPSWQVVHDKEKFSPWKRNNIKTSIWSLYDFMTVGLGFGLQPVHVPGVSKNCPYCPIYHSALLKLNWLVSPLEKTSDSKPPSGEGFENGLRLAYDRFSIGRVDPVRICWGPPLQNHTSVPLVGLPQKGWNTTPRAFPMFPNADNKVQQMYIKISEHSRIVVTAPCKSIL